MDTLLRQRASDSEASILFLPDELVERICLEAVEDGARFYRLKLHNLSKTCRRIRSILLPRIYRDVVLDNKQQLRFFQLTPMYGHLCRSVTLCISGYSPQNVPLFAIQCAYLTRLQVLRLHIENSSSACFSTRTHGPEVTFMSFADRMAWKSLCLALPGVSELHLHGFTWTDAVEGFKASGPKPSITKLCLDLAISVARPTLETASTLNRIFPGLISMSLSTHWCLTPAWIRRAFASQRLQSIEVGESVHGYDGGHDCFQKSCIWTSSMQALLELSATSLTSLAINCNLSPMLSFKRSAFPSLTTLTLEGMKVDNSMAFSTLMESFLHSPLQQLSIRGIRGPVPESFCSWFDPRSGRWPVLRTLSLQGIGTQCGPGDDHWESSLEERGGWDRLSDGDKCWSSHTRIKLEGYCTERGIEFDFDWEWFEGFG